jgi:hypothetical protein
MRHPSLLTLVLSMAVLACAPAFAKTRIIVLPPDAPNGAELLGQIAESVMRLPSGDRLLVYSARPVSQIAEIERPADPTMNKARMNAALAAQFKPIKDYLTALPASSSGEPPGNLMIPSLMEELGRNRLAGLPDKQADLLLVGSLLHWDRRDGRSAMTDRYVPSDATLRALRTEWPFSIVGAQERLKGVTVHFCSLGGENEFESEEHAERVRRFWSLWTTGQGGRVGTFSSDLATCFRRFNAGDASGQPVYQPSPGGKAEMLRVPAHVPATLPASFETPGQYFLREDMPISRTPPAVSKGIAWVGIKWNAACDLDLYARGDASQTWLYFGSTRTPEGYFNKDFRSGTGDGQYEYVEFTRDIDLAKAEVAINLYSCDAPAPPEGAIRIWFAAKVYEAPFKLTVKSGNKGAPPMSGPYWLRIDPRKVVGLTAE